MNPFPTFPLCRPGCAGEVGSLPIHLPFTHFGRAAPDVQLPGRGGQAGVTSPGACSPSVLVKQARYEGGS